MRKIYLVLRAALRRYTLSAEGRTNIRDRRSFVKVRDKRRKRCRGRKSEKSFNLETCEARFEDVSALRAALNDPKVLVIVGAVMLALSALTYHLGTLAVEKWDGVLPYRTTQSSCIGQYSKSQEDTNGQE